MSLGIGEGEIAFFWPVGDVAVSICVRPCRFVVRVAFVGVEPWAGDFLKEI